MARGRPLLAAVAGAAAFQPSLERLSAVERALAAAAAYLTARGIDAVVGAAAPLDRVPAAVPPALAGTTLAWALTARCAEGDDVAAGETLASAAIATALIGGAALLGAGRRALLRAMAGPGHPVRRALARTVVDGAVVATLLTGAGAALRRIDAAAGAVEPATADPPDLETVSGGPGSLVAYEALGLEGRRFVSEVTPPERITALTGDAATAPARVYVGLDAASTVAGRVELAVAEMDRVGAFDRDLIVLVSPAGSGFVDPVPIEAAEYLARGSVTTVALQYGKRPSVLSADRVGIGAAQFRALVEAVAARLRPRARLPRVVIYGESLGSRTAQDGFVGEGVPGIVRHGVSRVLLVGTPAAARWREEVLAGHTPGRARIRRVPRADEIRDQPDIVVWLLDHPDDPVTRFELRLAWSRPSWLGDPGRRPSGVPRRARWLPLVTFWLTAFDTRHAAALVPGGFGTAGHDYRGELGPAVARAFGPFAPLDLGRLQERLRRSEEERARRWAGTPEP